MDPRASVQADIYYLTSTEAQRAPDSSHMGREDESTLYNSTTVSALELSVLGGIEPHCDASKSVQQQTHWESFFQHSSPLWSEAIHAFGSQV